MKQKFSTAWKASSQARKQRKYRINSPLHIKQKFLASNLSEELRKKLGRRSLQVRKNDSVRIMRGKFKGKTGKINLVNIKKGRVAIEGIQRQKKDGTKINVYFNPSKIQITEMVDDKYRLTKIEKLGEKNAPNKK